MKLLLGVGGSEESFRALDKTVERVSETGEDLTVAAVEDAGSPLDVEEVETRVRERLSDAGIDAETVTLTGRWDCRLVEHAEREGYDRIVLPSERSPLGKITIGEATEFVLLNARVSVTIMK